jgi:hypothetical protein
MVLITADGAGDIADDEIDVIVDSDYPNAWLEEPWHQDLVDWSLQGVEVTISVGKQIIKL